MALDSAPVYTAVFSQDAQGDFVFSPQWLQWFLALAAEINAGGGSSGGGSSPTSFTSATANFTFSDQSTLYHCDSSGGNILAKLPASPADKDVYFAVQDTTVANTTTIDGNGHNIDWINNTSGALTTVATFNLGVDVGGVIYCMVFNATANKWLAFSS
jgi:hypothetical protein